jgi:hypothetical protein
MESLQPFARLTLNCDPSDFSLLSKDYRCEPFWVPDLLMILLGVLLSKLGNYIHKRGLFKKNKARQRKSSTEQNKSRSGYGFPDTVTFALETGIYILNMLLC